MDTSNRSNKKAVEIITGRKFIPEESLGTSDWLEILRVAMSEISSGFKYFSGFTPIKDIINADVYIGRRRTTNPSLTKFPKGIDAETRCLWIIMLYCGKKLSFNRYSGELLLMTKKMQLINWEFSYEMKESQDEVFSSEIQLISEDNFLKMLTDDPSWDKKHSLGGKILRRFCEITKENLEERKNRLDVAKKANAKINAISQRIVYQP